VANVVGGVDCVHLGSDRSQS